MKALAPLVLLVSSSSLIAGSFNNIGSNGNHYSLFSASDNPAMAELIVPSNESWRMSYSPALALTSEVGEVDNFIDDLEELVDILDDPSLVEDSVQETLDRFNAVLLQMGEDGYLNASAGISAPIFPLYFRSESLGGTLFSELSINNLIGMSVLDDVLAYEEQNGNFATNTSLYLKGAIETKFSVGYSRLLDIPGSSPYNGNVYGGIKLNVKQMELSKQVLALTQLGGEDIADIVQDEFDNNLNKSNAYSIDLGLVWDTDLFRAGITLENINSPTYKYGVIGTSCADIPDATVARSNCEAARYFSEVQGELKTRETHREYARFTLDALYKISNRWFVSAEWEADAYVDAVGNEYKWLRVSHVYEPESSWIPSTRIGYQTNLTGSELSSLNFGFTIFQGFLMDIQYGTEEATIDGTSAPRSFGFFMSFQERF